jgi:hypothetical protein
MYVGLCLTLLAVALVTLADDGGDISRKNVSGRCAREGSLRAPASALVTSPG